MSMIDIPDMRKGLWMGLGLMLALVLFAVGRWLFAAATSAMGHRHG